MDFTWTQPAKSVVEMTPEEFDAWLAEPDREPPPPSAWPLHCNEGRRGFLESFMWRGEAALFESVNHAWNSLGEPRGPKCIYIGMWAGTGGSGKWAIAKMLRRALREALDYEGVQPDWEPGQTLEEFHQASMSYFEADHLHYERAIQKYADILNGEPGRHSLAKAKLLFGPWGLNETGETRSPVSV